LVLLAQWFPARLRDTLVQRAVQRDEHSSSDSLRSMGEKEIHRYMMLIHEVSGGWNAGSRKSAVVSGAL
jgi:hypothetical protein